MSPTDPNDASAPKALVPGMADWPDGSDPAAWLEFHFARCWPWLDAALETSPVRTHRREDIEAGLRDGSFQLWPARSAACLTEVIEYPAGARVLHGWLAGGDLDEIKRTVGVIEDHARRIGCDAVSVSGRRGWVRAFDGYREAGATIAKALPTARGVH